MGVWGWGVLYTQPMRFASVVLDIPTQALDSAYTYAVPADLCQQGETLQVGCAVVVPFGGRRAIGFVVETMECPAGEYPEGVDPSKLKAVERVASAPFFDEEGAACAQWLAHRYLSPLSSCVRLFTPPGGVPRIVRGSEGWMVEEPVVGRVDDRWVVPGEAFSSFEPRKGAVKQEAIWQALQKGPVRVAELACEYGAVAQAIAALEKRDVVRIEHRRRMRGMGESAASSVPLPELTPGQQQALNAIEDAVSAADGQVVLVDGVTGSGKTEVYLRAISRVLEQGRTACVLVPEISLTPQTVARFRGRFGDSVAVIHSRMSQGERFDQWDFIRSSQARVVVGARSALFTPLANLGIIVIDEEHEGSYKQDSAPRYHARDVAVWMAKRAGATVVLGSATPSVDTLYQCAKTPGWNKVELPERANGRPLPQVEVLDMSLEFRNGSRAMFAKRLRDALQEELSAGRKAVLLLNQRGFAKFLLCRDCGFVPECPHCSTSLTFHEVGGKLVCHHCGHQENVPVRCPSCSSAYLKKFGAGTQRVEVELRALLDGMEGVGPEVPIIRMDADTTSKKGAHQRLLEEFANAGAAVLLGTQMIAKGLDFEDVTVVGVINADTQLHLPDYRAGERTFDLIEQVAGRAGRAELSGRVLVQTYEADNCAIRAAATYDRPLFLRADLPKRKLLGYPPYVRMANVLVWGKSEREVRQAAEQLHEQLAVRIRDFAGDAWQILPAGPCALGKLRGAFRYHILIKAPLGADIPRVIEPVFRSRRSTPGVSVAVDIDPNDLF